MSLNGIYLITSEHTVAVYVRLQHALMSSGSCSHFSKMNNQSILICKYSISLRKFMCSGM